MFNKRRYACLSPFPIILTKKDLIEERYMDGGPNG
jgi:hypothetical protein